jgi:diacylglycerol O-acyltransferase / wax synthase
MQSYYRRLSPKDAVNLAIESAGASMEVGTLILLEAGPLVDATGALRLRQLRRLVQRRLPGAPELLQKIDFPGPLAGRSVWVDDRDFDIAQHVMADVLPAPGGEPELLAAASRLMGMRLARGRPPWQIWFLTGLAGGRVAMLIKLHHVLADGTATVHLTRCLLDLARVPSDPAFPAWIPAPAPGYAELLIDNLAGKAVGAARLLKALTHPIASWRAMTIELSELRATLRAGRGAPRLSINRPVGGARHLNLARFDLAEVKAVAHAHGAKVNDVLLDLVAAGLGELLAWRGETVEGVSVRASVAISLRSGGDSGRSGNQVGNMIVRVPLEVRGGERLELIAAASRQARRDQGGAPVTGFTVFLAHLGLARFVMRHQHLVNVLVSNLAGPPIEEYLMGARVLDAIPITPIAGNVGLGFAALSYAGRFDLCVVADTAQAVDMDVLLTGIQQRWLDLRSAPSTAKP